jgi:ent-kaurenoic acid hydroxylase
MEPSPLTVKMDQWFTNLVAGLRAFPLDFPGTACHDARKCRRKLNAVFQEELEARKNTTKKYDDVMSGFMELEDEQGKKLSDDEVVDNIVSVVVAGYESTASAIMWATYHLAKSPDILAKLRVRNIYIFVIPYIPITDVGQSNLFASNNIIEKLSKSHILFSRNNKNNIEAHTYIDRPLKTRITKL